MNLYFLVEGRRTEKKIYPKWLSHLVPSLVEINQPHNVETNNYYIFSGNGYPSLKNHLKNALEDVVSINKFDYFVICLDAEECTVIERENEINDFIISEKINMPQNLKFIVIVQNRCIETWLLGNKKLVKRNPTRNDLNDYLSYYDVRINDPETMGKLSFETHAQFHSDFLSEIFQERGLSYSKKHPKEVTEKYFLEQLIKRSAISNHIGTFRNFLDFCNEINERIE